MYKLVLLRHGESQWNLDNRFTGWTDVDITENGWREARKAGELLLKEGFSFDLAYTSVLKRAIRTLYTVLDVMDSMWIPVIKDWHLNERHYGVLQGLDKAETAAKYGEEQVHIWRRSYTIAPDPLDRNDPRHPRFDSRYKYLKPNELPATECLKDTVARVIPYWKQVIAPEIHAGKKIIIGAHGNSLRALVKYLDNLTDEAIIKLNIPTARPLIYELDDQLKPIKNYYLGNPNEIAAAMAAVAAQGKAKE